MMSAALGAFLVFLAANVIAGLWRVVRGPTAADRLLAPLLFGTTGSAMLVVAADVLATPALRDVALVLVLLAVVTTTVFTRRAWSGAGEDAP